MSLADAKRWLKKARDRFRKAAGQLRNVIGKLGAAKRKRHEAVPGTELRHRLAKRVVAYKHRVQELIKSKARREREKERLAKKVKWLKEHKDDVPDAGDNLGKWGSFTVAGWMVGLDPGPGGSKINWLQRIKDTGKWAGGLYSAYRTPEYSQSLCFGICGAPSCPGLCAGLTSGHSQKVYPGGCIDVQDWPGFAAGNAQVGGPFRNNLPNDRPHRSVSGY